MMGRKFLKVVTLGIVGLVSFYMAKWFGFKAVVGIWIVMACMGILFGMHSAESEEKLIDKTVDIILTAIDEYCTTAEENGEEYFEFDDVEIRETIRDRIENGE